MGFRVANTGPAKSQSYNIYKVDLHYLSFNVCKLHMQDVHVT
jgi:hypothetical protein